MSATSTAAPATVPERAPRPRPWSIRTSMTIIVVSLLVNGTSLFYHDIFDFQPDVQSAASTLTKNSSWTLVADNSADDQVIQRWKSSATDIPTVDSIEALFKAKGFDDISCRGPFADHAFFCVGKMWSGLGTAYTAVNVESVSSRTDLKKNEKEIILISSDAYEPRR